MFIIRKFYTVNTFTKRLNYQFYEKTLNFRKLMFVVMASGCDLNISVQHVYVLKF